METSAKRMSMNTSLKDARIFDDDSWEEHQLQATPPNLNLKIKKEPDFISFNIEPEPEIAIKEEYNIKIESGVTIKHEHDSSPELDVIKQVETNSNSPFNKDLFNSLKIRQDIYEQLESPIKLEADEKVSSSRKSAKRSVFTRASPYKLPTECDVSEQNRAAVKTSIFSRLGDKVDVSETQSPKRKIAKRPDMETDPETLQRRQKQIDFGKNTTGYDNYKRSVAKKDRKSDDPQTPNKFSKYSRRGWDGLIKQWRLKLHKYDPDN